MMLILVAILASLAAVSIVCSPELGPDVRRIRRHLGRRAPVASPPYIPRRAVTMPRRSAPGHPPWLTAPIPRVDADGYLGQRTGVVP